MTATMTKTLTYLAFGILHNDGVPQPRDLDNGNKRRAARKLADLGLCTFDGYTARLTDAGVAEWLKSLNAS